MFGDEREYLETALLAHFKASREFKPLRTLRIALCFFDLLGSRKGALFHLFLLVRRHRGGRQAFKSPTSLEFELVGIPIDF